MRRLFDDPQLPAALRRDLQQSRAAAQDYAVSEKLLQLRAALSDNARQPLGQEGRWSDVGSPAAWRISHPGWKLLVVMALTGAGAVVVQQMRSHEPQPVAAVEPTPQPVEEAPLAPQPPAAELVEAQPAPVEAHSERPRGARAPAAKAPIPGSSSRREIAQLVRIRELLKKDPAAAYDLAQRSEREFPSGLLSEERQALAIMALAKVGDAGDARRRANAFFLRYPQSPMREQIEAALVR